MTEFEYLSVFASVIFGLTLTQILSGSVRSLYQGELSENQLVYTMFAIAVLILSWWVSFTWSLREEWTYSAFFVFVIWSMSYYGFAATMYPPASANSGSFKQRRKYFLGAFFTISCIDIVATAVRGGIFLDYLLFLGQYLFFSGLGVYSASDKLHRFISWWLLLATLAWSFTVRNQLSSLT